jgi:hypothetical protein
VTNVSATNVSYNLCVFPFKDYTVLPENVCVPNTLVHSNDAHYYVFNVESNAVFAEFATLNSTGDVDLYLRQFPPPGPQFGNYDWSSETFGTGDESITIDTNSFPFPLAGGPWYLVVVNREPGPVDYCIRAKQGVITPITSAQCGQFLLIGGNAVQYFQVPISSAALRAEFTVSNATGNVDMYINPHPPLSVPGPGNAIRSSTNPGNADELISLSQGSTPPLQAPGAYTIAITNLSPLLVSYSLCVTEQTNGIPLVNGTCLTNTLMGVSDTHYFAVNIFSNSMRADFMTLQASGNVDLYIQHFPTPTVGPAAFEYRSINPGSVDELLVVTRTNQPPLVTGDWYIAVVNQDPGSVTYCLKVMQYPALNPFDIRLFITNGFSLFPPHVDLGWTGYDIQEFHLEYSDSLSPPVWQPFADINGPVVFGPVGNASAPASHTFQDDGSLTPPGLPPMRFYRLRVLP